MSIGQYNSSVMSILKVARMGNPVLRTAARPLERSQLKGAMMQKLIDDMIETMIEYRGVGLAAPQVHEGVRLFVAQLDTNEDRDKREDPVAIVNPEVTPIGTDIV